VPDHARATRGSAPAAGSPSASAAQDLEQAKEDVFEDVAAATDEDEVAMLRDLRELVEDHPGAMDAVLQRAAAETDD